MSLSKLSEYSGECRIKGKGMKYMAEYNLINLKILNLSTWILYIDQNIISNFGVKGFCKSNLPSLEVLRISMDVCDIGDCSIGCEGFRHLAKAKCPSLISLWLTFSYNNNTFMIKLDSNRIGLIGWQVMH